ncbi:MAG: FadD3 family acyl-CoA ligase [Sphingopyxis sp.]|uniref:FadD3 family acyl-CoA ligase n=1 Tax=Sphingopyxis sp. TaxID=1908224 RepID=UPI0032EB3865
MTRPLPATIPHLVEAAARHRGAAAALIEEDVRWSYDDVWREARIAASAMLAHGLGDGDRVAIWAPNSRRWIAAAVGAMICGAAIVPLNTRLKGGEAADILRRTGAKLLFLVGEFLGTDYRALLSDQKLPSLSHVICLQSDWDGFRRAGDAGDPRVDAAMQRLTPDHVSDILFTSGTTGRAKGVLSSHRNVVPMVWEWAELVGLEEGDHYLIINPFFHSFGYKAGWVAALLRGAAIYPVSSFDVRRVARLIERERISFLPGPPTIYQSLLAAKAENDFSTASLRGGVTGAASVPADLVRRMRSELGLVDAVTAYGMTECVFITACRRGDPVELVADSCGRAMPGVELRIVDDAGRALGAGETGEICVRGAGVMLGYLDDPAATGEVIDEDGWLRTGDVGMLDDAGYLRITDRKKDMYISGGFNVYPAEVENMLCSHPAVAQAAVIGVGDERLGEVGRAFVVLRPNADADADQILQWARQNMANYKAPRFVETVGALPLNASGKVVKDELRRLS